MLAIVYWAGAELFLIDRAKAADKPFFLYVPWTAPHFPADPHPDWHGKSGENKSANKTKP